MPDSDHGHADGQCRPCHNLDNRHAVIRYLLILLPIWGQCQPVSVSLCDTERLLLSAEIDTGTYQWYVEDQAVAVLYLTEPDSISLTVVATAPNGCETVQNVRVSVEACEVLYLPVAFSPDGDGLNDVFRPVGTVSEWDMTIFDQWGAEIFSGKEWTGNEIADTYVVRLSWIENGVNKLRYSRVTLVL